MGDRSGKSGQTREPSAAWQIQRARHLKQRSIVIGFLGLLVVLFLGISSAHWVWSLVIGLFTLFLVFGLDDEIQALERDQKEL